MPIGVDEEEVDSEENIGATGVAEECVAEGEAVDEVVVVVEEKGIQEAHETHDIIDRPYQHIADRCAMTAPSIQSQREPNAFILASHILAFGVPDFRPLLFDSEHFRVQHWLYTTCHAPG